jgi:hypothetical protein
LPGEIVAHSTEVPSADKSGAVAPVVLDLGRKSKKKIKALRKGKQGKLMAQVTEAIAQLKAEGVVAANAQPIVVVVRERNTNRMRNLPSLWP